MQDSYVHFTIEEYNPGVAVSNEEHDTFNDLDHTTFTDI